MKNQKNLLLTITVLTFVLCCLTPLVHAQISPQTIKETFDVRPGGQLTLNSQFGTIDVKINSRNQVSFVATKAVRPNINMIIGGFTKSELDRLVQEALTDFEVTFSQTGSNVLIQGKFRRGWEYWQRQSQVMTYILAKLKIDFQVRVPRQYNVDLKTAFGGNILTDNIGGELKAESGWGDINLGSVTGTVNAKTGNGGDITLKGCQSTVEAISGWGDINLGNVTRTVNAITGNGGDITLNDCESTVAVRSDWGNLQLGNVAGVVNAKTGNGGDITLKGCQSTVEAITGWGDINLGNVARTVNAITGNGGNIGLNNVGGKLKAETGWGDITLVNIAGVVNAKTGNGGNIILQDCQNTVEAITGWGDIRADMTKQFTRPWTLQTSNNGEIVVMLLPNIAIDVDAYASSGSVSSDFRVQGSTSKNSIKGTINGGGPLLKMRASWGDIYLRRK